MKLAFYTILLGIFMTIAGVTHVFATEQESFSVAEFPVCANPTGELIADYATGTHGIPGSPASYPGSDKVYKINANQLTQCFCNENGSGIQSNWLKAANLSDDQIDTYIQNGWIQIPNGQNWGLDEGAYLVKNLDYTCKGTGGSTSAGGSSGSNSSGGSSNNGSVIGTSTKAILGLATTGNMKDIFLLLATGIAFLFVGFRLAKSNN